MASGLPSNDRLGESREQEGDGIHVDCWRALNIYFKKKGPEGALSSLTVSPIGSDYGQLAAPTSTQTSFLPGSSP